MTLICPFCNASLDTTGTRCPYCNGAIDPVLGAGERVADRFAVQDVLSAGSMGITYRVRDVGSNVDLALLAIADELCPTVADRLSFLSKIEMFAGRTIAGCVMPLEVGADDRGAFVVSPLVEGVMLRAVLGARSAARQKFTFDEALRVMISLAASTSALHSATPHGGLCPDTVLVTARGLLLTDCTVALAVPLDKFQPRIQRFSRAVPFVSPEAARGKRISAVADLYALGAIASELLVGSPLERALETAQLDPSLEAPIRAMLDRDPGKRPGALGALLDALSKASGLDRRPAEPPLPVPESPSPAPDTSRQAAADWAAFTGSNAPAPPPRDVRREQEPTTPRRKRPPPPTPMPAASIEIAPGTEVPDDPTAFDMPVAPALPPSIRAANPVVPPSIPGRLGPPTGAMPASRAAPPGVSGLPSLADSFRSGPPGGVSAMRSGPPVPSLPSAGQAPPALPRVPSFPGAPGGRANLPSIPRGPGPSPGARAPASPAAPARPSDRPRQAAAPRDLDGIDPRLLRAARRLEAERGENDEIDVGEIELVDD